MQLQSTFGAFLVAFTMVHAAPFLEAPDHKVDPAINNNMGVKPHNLPLEDYTFQPGRVSANPIGITARDPKGGKGGGAGGAGHGGAGRGPMSGKGISHGKPDGSQMHKGDFAHRNILDEIPPVSDEVFDDDQQDTTQGAPVMRRSPKGSKGPSGKPPGGNPGKPPGGKPDGSKPDGGNSFGQDVLSNTAGTVISDGIWYGVDQATAGNPPVKRAPAKGKGPSGKPSGGNSGKPPGGKPDGSKPDGVKPDGGKSDGGNSFGQDVLSNAAGSVISDGIRYGADQAMAGEAPAEEAPAKRSPKGSKGSGSGSRFGGFGKDVAADVIGDGISTGIYTGLDQVTNTNEKRLFSDKADSTKDLDMTGGCGSDKPCSNENKQGGEGPKGPDPVFNKDRLSKLREGTTCAGTLEACSHEKPNRKPLMNPDVTCAGINCGQNNWVNDIAVGGIAKRGKSRNKGSKDGGKDNSQASKKGGDDSDNNPSDDDRGSGSRGGFRDGAKDMALNIAGDAASQAVNAGVQAALYPQPGEVPIPAEGEEPVEQPAKRALRFSA